MHFIMVTGRGYTYYAVFANDMKRWTGWYENVTYVSISKLGSNPSNSTLKEYCGILESNGYVINLLVEITEPQDIISLHPELFI